MPVCSYRRVDEVAAEASQARESPILVRSREPALAYDIRDQNRRELSGLAHRPLRLAEAWHKDCRSNPGCFLRGCESLDCSGGFFVGARSGL